MAKFIKLITCDRRGGNEERRIINVDHIVNAKPVPEDEQLTFVVTTRLTYDFEGENIAHYGETHFAKITIEELFNILTD